MDFLCRECVAVSGTMDLLCRGEGGEGGRVGCVGVVKDTLCQKGEGITMEDHGIKSPVCSILMIVTLKALYQNVP